MYTAPAIWARMEATQPLVARDDPELWRSPRDLDLWRSWPFASAETRTDFADWRAALQEVHRTSPELGLIECFNAAFDHLSLPLRRKNRIVRAIHARLQESLLALRSAKQDAGVGQSLS